MNAILLGAIAALAWGVHDLLIRFVSRSLGSLQSVVAVFVCGAVALLVAMWIRGEHLHFHDGNLLIVALSGIAYAFGFIWLFKAFEIGPVSLVSPIVGAYPVLAMAWAVANGRIPTPIDLLAVAGIIAGVILVARYAAEVPHVAGHVATGTRTQAVVYSLLSCLGFAFTLTAGQFAAQASGEINVTLTGRLWGLAVLVPLCWRDGGSFSGAGQSLPLLMLMGVLDAVALTAVTSAGRWDGAEFATVIGSCFGAVTVFLAVVFLKERLHQLQLMGMLMILAGVVTLSSHS